MLERTIGPAVPSLAGQRIILVGAGSVGSYLALALVRAGAGSGSGELKIFDNDNVAVENITRSAFDSRQLGLNKAAAISEMASTVLIDASVSGNASSAPMTASQYECDLIIDATGDHSYSTWLSNERMLGRVPPVLFAWVSGQGAAVVSYLQADTNSSCLACLGTADSNSDWNPLLDPLEAAAHQLGSCGESFMPYSVAAPMTASALACSHALSWVSAQSVTRIGSVVLAPDRAKPLPAVVPTCGCSRV